jgi:hypothetical protein
LTGALEPGKADGGAFIGMALIHSAVAGGSGNGVACRRFCLRRLTAWV